MKKLYHGGMWWQRLTEILFPPRPTERMVRETSTLLSEHARPWFIDGTELKTIALLPYREPSVKAHIIESKFHGNNLAHTTLGTILGEYLHEHLTDEVSYQTKSYVLIPLPLGEKRKQERGYNQVEEICRSACSHLETLPISLIPEVLTRTRDTLPQTSLPAAARKKNMEGAFKATEPLRSDYTYIIVDDVVTTGATLLNATAALRAAGATTVLPITLAY